MSLGDKMLALLLALGIVASAMALWRPFAGGAAARRGGQASQAELDIAGRPAETLDLDRSRQIAYELPRRGIAGGGRLLVETGVGRIRIVHASCPTQKCVLTGWVARPGGHIICAPGGVVVTVLGPAAARVDTVAF